MSDAETAQRDTRLAWTIGGSLLVASGAAVLMAHTSYGFFGWLAIAGDIAWFLALLVFAFGVRGSGSVVAAQVPGVIALLVAGAVPLLSPLLWWVVPAETMPPGIAAMLGESTLVVSLLALIVAAVTIARAGVVPQPVRWVPLVAVALVALVRLIPYLVAVGAARPDPVLMTSLGLLGSLVAAASMIALGVLAIVFAPREAPRVDAPVQIYPSA